MKTEPKISTMTGGNVLRFKVHDAKERPKKGILKTTTVDESITTKYSGSTPSTVPVTFDNIEVREYSVVLGDHPSCTSGPPVSIGWSYNEGIVIGVDEYENLRQQRRNYMQMAIPRIVREEILMQEFGFSRSQLAVAVRENVKAKNQRRQTINNLGNYSKMEELIETVRRKFKRGLCMRSDSLETMMYDRNWLDQSQKSAQFVAEETAASQQQLEQNATTINYPLEDQQQKISEHRIPSVEIPTPIPWHSNHSEADRGSEPDVASRRYSGISATESHSTVDEYLGKIKGFHEDIPNIPQQLQQQQDVPFIHPER